MKAYKQYEKERRPLDRLSDEDRFMLQVCTKKLYTVMSTKRSWNLSMYDPGLYIWDGQHIIFLLIFTLSLPFQLSKIERLSQKLHIMSFIGNFNENVHHLAPVSHPKDKLQSTSTFVIFCFIVINRCLFPVMMQQNMFCHFVNLLTSYSCQMILNFFYYW